VEPFELKAKTTRPPRRPGLEQDDDIPLTELEGDLFSSNRWFFQTVQFTRDSEKRITGFRLSSGRARNVTFDKQ
jgi:hypothetical protein